LISHNYFGFDSFQTFVQLLETEKERENGH